jgi:Ca2+-binding RTX toxin-like protein
MVTKNGGSGSDYMSGTAGNDSLYGAGGDDILYGGYNGAGDDTLDGGSGTDTADYSGVASSVFVNLEKGTAHGSAVGYDTLYNIEAVVGGAGNDIILGREADFFGYRGDDVLAGGGGGDNLYGQSGNDTLYGGTGIDVLNGGDGNDKLLGGADIDFLRGDAGNDALYGEGGDDRLYGDPGSDTLDGGAGFDTADYSQIAGYDHGTFVTGVELWRSGGTVFDSPEAYDTLLNIERVVGSPFEDFIQGDRLGVNTANLIEGGDGGDWLYGDGGNDTLIGGNGDDLLEGGTGLDIFTGGAGKDEFTFRSFESGVGAGNRDVVTDYQQGWDDLYFIMSTGGPSIHLGFVGQGAFTTANQVRYTYEGSDTVVQVNLDADALPELEVQLTGHVALTASDIFSY